MTSDSSGTRKEIVADAKQSPFAQRGMTLLEIMIVLAILAS
jgi:prepilin-type N-terminal cleavage/methylation domain-containing protein